MRDLTDRALDTATRRGASYADVRVVHSLSESISVKSGRVEGVASGESEGFGVRVLVDGAWGFASSRSIDAAEIDRVAAEAVRIARASATRRRRSRKRKSKPAGSPDIVRR
jgi:TldD protein